jgi:hypothetical protein
MTENRYEHSEFEQTIGREIRRLLSVDPPPGFESRVCARVEQKPARVSWNLRWIVGVAAAAAAVVSIVLVFQPRAGGGHGGQRGNVPQRAANTEVAPAASPSLSPSREIQSPAPPKSRPVYHRVTKTEKIEPQLMIAPDEASALRRLLNGELTELPQPFQPDVKQFQIPETIVEPLPAPAPVTIDPIAPLQPAAG